MKMILWLRSLVLSVIFACSVVYAEEAAVSVNINTADAQTIAESLNGIGAARAQAIVQWRETHGPFTSVEQLIDVKGVGEKVLEKNRARIVLE